MSHFTPSVPTSRRPLPSSLSSTRHANSYSPYPTSLRPSHFPSRPRFPASPAIPLSPYTSLTPASDSPYPLSAPAPTPSSAFRTSSSAGRSRSRENPFEQLDAPAFDHFVDDIAGRIRSALAGPSKPKRVRREEREKKKGEMGEREKEERDVFGEIKAVEVEPAEAGTSSPPHSPQKHEAQAPLFAPASTISASTSEIDQLDHSERPPLSPSRSVSEALVLSSDEEEEEEEDEESELASSDAPVDAESEPWGIQILGRPFPSNPSLFLPSHSNSPAPPIRTVDAGVSNLFDALDEGLNVDDLQELEEARAELEGDREEGQEESEEYASFRRQDEAQFEADQLEEEEEEEEEKLPPPFSRTQRTKEREQQEEESEEVVTPRSHEEEEETDYEDQRQTMQPPPSQMKASLRGRRYSFDEDEEEGSPVAARRRKEVEDEEEEEQDGEEWFGEDAGGDEVDGEGEEERSSSEPLGTRIPYHLKGKGRAPTPPTPSSASPSLPPSSSADAETDSEAASDISFSSSSLPTYSLPRLRSILRTLAGYALALEEDGEGSEDGETLELVKERMLGVERVYEERVAFEGDGEGESEDEDGEEAEWSEMAPSGGKDMRSLLSPNPSSSRPSGQAGAEQADDEQDEDEQGFFDPEPPSEFDIHVPSSDEDEMLPPTTDDDHFPIDPSSAIAERELEEEEEEEGMTPEERAAKMQIEQLARELVEKEGRGGVTVGSRATFGGEQEGAREEQGAKMDFEAIYGELDDDDTTLPPAVEGETFDPVLLFADAQQQPHPSVVAEEDDLLVTSVPAPTSLPSEAAVPSQADLTALLNSFVDSSSNSPTVDYSLPLQSQDQAAASTALDSMFIGFLPPPQETQETQGEAEMTIDEFLAAPASSSGAVEQQQQQQIDMFAAFPSADRPQERHLDSTLLPPPSTTEDDLLVSHQPRDAQEEDEPLLITAAPSTLTQPDLYAPLSSPPPAAAFDPLDLPPSQAQAQAQQELAPVDLTSSSPPPETETNAQALPRPPLSPPLAQNAHVADEEQQEDHRSPTRFQGIFSALQQDDVASQEENADAEEEEEEDQLASSPVATSDRPILALRGRRVPPSLRKARRSNGGRIHSVVPSAAAEGEAEGDLLGVGDYGSESCEDAAGEDEGEGKNQVLEEMLLSSSEDESEEGEWGSVAPSSEPMSYDESDEEETEDETREVALEAKIEQHEQDDDEPIAVESARSPSIPPPIDLPTLAAEEALASIPSVTEEQLAPVPSTADEELPSAPSTTDDEQLAPSTADDQPHPSTTAVDDQLAPIPLSPLRVRDVLSPGAWDPSTPIRFGPSSLEVAASVPEIAEEVESLLEEVEAEVEVALVGEVEEILEEVEAEVLHDEEEAEEMVEELLEGVEELVRGELEEEPFGEREQIEIDVQMDVEVVEGESSRQADEINSVRGLSAAIEDDSDHPIVTLITEQVVITATAVEEPAEPTADAPSSTPRSSPPVELPSAEPSNTEKLVTEPIDADHAFPQAVAAEPAIDFPPVEEAGPVEVTTTSPIGSPPTSTTPLLPSTSTTPFFTPALTTPFYPPPDTTTAEVDTSAPASEQVVEGERSTESLVDSTEPVESLVEENKVAEGDETLNAPLESTTPAGTPPPATEEEEEGTTTSSALPQLAAAAAEVQQPTPPAEEGLLVDFLEDASTHNIDSEEQPIPVAEPTAAVEEDPESSSDDDSDDSLVISSALLGSRNDTPLVAEEIATLDVDGTPPFTPFVHTPASEIAEAQDEQEQEQIEGDGVEPEEGMSIGKMEQIDSPPTPTPTNDAAPPSDDDSEFEDELNLLPLPPATRSNESAPTFLSTTTALEAPSPRRTSSRFRPTPCRENIQEAESSSQPRRSTRGRREPAAESSQADTSQTEVADAPSASGSVRRSTRLGGAAEEPMASTLTSPTMPKGKRARPSDAPTPAAIASPSASASKRLRGQDPSEAPEDEAPARPLARQHTHCNSNVLRGEPSSSSSTSTSTPHLPVTRSHCELHKLEFRSNIMRSPYHVAMPSCALSFQLARETMESFSVTDLGPLPSPSTGTRLGGAGLVDGPAADDERDVELFNGEEDVLAAVRRVAGVELYDEGAVELLPGEGEGRGLRTPRKRGAEEQEKEGKNKKRK